MKEEGLTNTWENPECKVSKKQANASLGILLTRIDMYESMRKRVKSPKYSVRIRHIVECLFILFFLLTFIKPSNPSDRELNVYHDFTKQSSYLICEDMLLPKLNMTARFMNNESISNVLNTLNKEVNKISRRETLFTFNHQ